MRLMRLIVLAVFFLLLFAQPSLAFNVQENWVGNQVRWEDEDLPIQWRLDSGNIPAGSARRTAVNQALDAWNRTGGLRLLFTTSGNAETDSVMEEGDGKSEIGFTTRNEIDGAAGREFTTHNCAGCRRIVESDIAIANDVGPNDDPPTSQFTGCTAQGVLIHELGHTIGLDHESTRLAMMQPSCNDTPLVRGAASGYMVLPDDQQGARQQYAGNGDEVNLIAISQYLFRELPVLYRDRYTTLEQAGIIDPNANNQRLVNYGLAGTRRAFNPDILECAAFAGFDPACEGSFYDVMGAEPRAQNLCPGDSFDVPFTVANRANSAATSKEHSIGFYLTDGTDVPFDPTEQFPGVPPLAGAILDNEIEFDSTGSLNTTGVQRLTLSTDPDCAPAGEYRLWHGVDICHEHLEGNDTVAAGGILENDNFALTGFFINILDPGASQCSALALPASDGVCDLAEIRKTCDAPPLEPPDGGPQPPEDCNPGEEDCVCQVTFGQLGTEEGHPDGDHSINEFCPDDGDIERTCVSQGAFGLCTTCNDGGDRHVGCRCTDDDQCADGLTCWGEETQNGSGVGHCYDEDDGPPSWICIADCQALFNSEQAFCLNNHITGEGFCLDGGCGEPEAFQCWTEGQLAGDDDPSSLGPVCRFSDEPGEEIACVSECGPGSDPADPTADVTCQSLGYPEIYECDLPVAGGACRRGPL
jgi:hypothetical protein